MASSDCPCFLPVKNCVKVHQVYHFGDVKDFFLPAQPPPLRMGPAPFSTPHPSWNTPLVVGQPVLAGACSWPVLTTTQPVFIVNINTEDGGDITWPTRRELFTIRRRLSLPIATYLAAEAVYVVIITVHSPTCLPLRRLHMRRDAKYSQESHSRPTRRRLVQTCSATGFRRLCPWNRCQKPAPENRYQ